MFIFPQYRKLKERSYYKISSHSEMEEIQRLGKRFFLFQVTASTFLDRNLILDLLEGDNGRYEIIFKEDYDRIRSLIG